MKFTSLLGNRLVLALVASIFLVGCGGGGESSSNPPPTPTSSKVLTWTPPNNFADQTPLDPAKDLDHYEIYVKETGSFSPTDAVDATVSAVDPANGGLVTSFNIANIAPFLSPKVTYYVSMKSVSVTGVKSDFSPAVSFSL